MTTSRIARGPRTLTDQLHLSHARALRPEVVPVTNSTLNWRKPAVGTGLWTSTFKSGRTSAWAESGLARGRYAFVLHPDSAARVRTIHGLPDLERLLKRYRRTDFGQRDWLADFGYLDYARLAQDVDALHLTERGQRQTRLTIPDLYGWDTESTLWFRWCFSAVERIAYP